MIISEKDSATKGFKKWSLARPANNYDNDKPGGDTPAARDMPVRKFSNQQSHTAILATRVAKAR
jgi:hypothetical protein